jgi:hypothetical protein
MYRLLTALTCLVLISGCSQTSTNNAETSVPAAGSSGGGGSGSVLSTLRAKADPAVLARIRAEEEQRAQQGQLNGEAPQQGDASLSTDASVSGLPQVSSAPFAPPADQAVAGGPIITPAGAQPAPAAQPPAAPAFPFWPFGPAPGTVPAPGPPPPPVASYGGYGGGGVPAPPPGGGLVPPPPAVLGTSAQVMPTDPYGQNPYAANPYAQQQQQVAVAPARPSLFGGGQRTTSSDDDEDSPKSKRKNFVPITPTGMESRSAYKQRDDLKVLWKGALSTSAVGRMAARDEKLNAGLVKLDVGLPPESTKGSVNVSQRVVDTVFKSDSVDRRIVGQVKALQKELAENYYRYLHAYNRFSLSSQTVAARKQEVEFAGSASEQQRAAADLAQAQNEADSAKEDMRAAQQELAAVAGAESARLIIGRVSGVSPSAASLAVAEAAPTPSQPSAAAGFFKGLMVNPFAKGQAKVAEQPAPKAENPKVKVKKGKGGDGDDLAPAPQSAAAAPREREPAPAPEPPAAGGPIAFELKNVNITPRKSILKVAIRNNSSDSFSFNPDSVSISEGNKKLSEATVRAEFDVTLVAPNQEVTGTITIFGRPWNDRLSVALSEGGKNIQLKR